VTLHVAAAQRKVEEARARASQPAFLGRPVPAVLDEIGTLFDRPPFGATPERLRDLAVQTLIPLEENVVELEEAAWNDAVLASSLRESLLRVESGLRSSWFSAIRVSVEARRAALGLRLTLRAPPYPKPTVRTPRFPVDLRECVRAYEEDAQDRLNDLARRVEVLYLLTEGGNAIPYRGDSLPTASAREKLEEARARAARVKPLEAPVPGVLNRIGSLLESLSSGLKSPQGRGTYFLTVTPLEENVLELAEGLRAEAVTVGGIAAAIQQIDDGSLRGPTLEALRTSIQARRAARP
jgi:hypothetical protein